MKTVFFVNCTDTGSTGKIIQEIAVIAEKQNYRCVLCAPNITTPDLRCLNKYRVSNRLFRAVAYRISKITGNYYGMGNLTTLAIIRKIRREKANLVHIHCANGSFMNLHMLFNWLKKNKISTVVTNHAEFFYTGNCDHAYDCNRWMSGCGQCPRKLSKIDTTAKWWKKMKETFQDFPQLIVTSVSPWVMSRSSASPIMDGVEQCLIMNGVNTEVFHVYEEENIWKSYGITPGQRRIVLYVTACFYGDKEEKGSKYLLRLAEKMADENVLFVVAGNYIPGIQIPKNVHLLGRIVDQQELAKIYNAADLALITSQRETFSMPVAEALCCGTPVVGFCAGGPESIAPEKFAEFTPFGDVDALENAIRGKWLYFKNAENSLQISDFAKHHFGSKSMADSYLSIYECMTGEAR